MEKNIAKSNKTKSVLENNLKNICEMIPKIETENLEQLAKSFEAIEMQLKFCLNKNYGSFAKLSSITNALLLDNGTYNNLINQIKSLNNNFDKIRFDNKFYSNLFGYYFNNFQSEKIEKTLSIFIKILNSEYFDKIYCLFYNMHVDNADSFNEQKIEIEKEEIIKELEVSLKKSSGIQESIYNFFEKFKKENYIFYLAFMFFISIFCVPYLQEEIGKPIVSKVVSTVKDAIGGNGDKVGELKENQNAFIIGNENYYYKIVYIDENGEFKEGYVAKRNIELIINEKDW